MEKSNHYAHANPTKRYIDNSHGLACSLLMNDLIYLVKILYVGNFYKYDYSYASFRVADIQDLCNMIIFKEILKVV